MKIMQIPIQMRNRMILDFKIRMIIMKMKMMMIMTIMKMQTGGVNYLQIEPQCINLLESKMDSTKKLHQILQMMQYLEIISCCFFHTVLPIILLETNRYMDQAFAAKDRTLPPLQEILMKDMFAFFPRHSDGSRP
jgi:hypothetical protein